MSSQFFTVNAYVWIPELWTKCAFWGVTLSNCLLVVQQPLLPSDRSVLKKYPDRGKKKTNIFIPPVSHCSSCYYSAVNMVMRSHSKHKALSLSLEIPNWFFLTLLKKNNLQGIQRMQWCTHSVVFFPSHNSSILLKYYQNLPNCTSMVQPLEDLFPDNVSFTKGPSDNLHKLHQIPS